MSAENRLYFVVRTDLPVGRQMAQAIHAMDEWTARYGPQKGTVIVYQVDSEEELLKHLPAEGQTALWREPDLGHQATAFATDQGRFDLDATPTGKRRDPSGVSPLGGTPPHGRVVQWSEHRGEAEKDWQVPSGRPTAR